MHKLRLQTWQNWTHVVKLWLMTLRFVCLNIHPQKWRLDKIQQDLNAKAKDWNLIKTMVKKKTLIINRPIKVCWKIYKRLVKKKFLTTHITSTGHNIKWDHFEILTTGRCDIHWVFIDQGFITSTGTQY